MTFGLTITKINGANYYRQFPGGGDVEGELSEGPQGWRQNRVRGERYGCRAANSPVRIMAKEP